MLSPVAHAARVARAHARGLRAYLAGRAPKDTVRVAYGLDVPEPDEPSVGGIVKLQHLVQEFPDTPHGFYADYRPSYRKDEAQNGWQRLQEWFKKYGMA